MAQRRGNQGRSADRKGRQVLGRQRTQQIRHGMDELEVPEDFEPLAGPIPSGSDLGPDDDIDGDLLLDDAGDSALPFAEEEVNGTTRASRAALTDLIGTRRPVLLVRLRWSGTIVLAEGVTVPRSRSAADALEELRLFIESRFREGLADWTDSDRARLLGDEAAPLSERLLLLGRLAVNANASLSIAAEGAGAAPLRFTPHDRGLQRYAGKFAALPDGLPFSLRWLLKDGRGQKGSSHPFDQLPLGVKLLALRRVLRAEEEAKQATKDDGLREPICDALAQMGIPIEKKPTWRHITRLREALKRHGLGHLFPQQKDRQKDYANSSAAPVAPGDVA